MSDIKHPPIAIVGVGAVLPDAPNAVQFWENIKNGRYSITEVPHDRWDPDLFFDSDPKAPAKTYSKIGGWVQDWEWNPMAWRLPIPPKVADAMDLAQKWAVAGTRHALADYGYPERPLDTERTAVIIGNAMAGDQHYLTAIRIFLPEYELELARAESFAQLEPDIQKAIRQEFGDRVAAHFPEITEDSMPGELGNIIAGRVANLFDLRGPNFVTDAACASAMAAMGAAIEGLEQHDYDAVITGGVDSNMSASTFTKFCKIGALSATGTRPYAEGADGFVMGEGAALFLLKRLEDAVRDEDPIYALIRSVGGSSDGRGKGITAPNPKGQRLAVERAWQRAGLIPDNATLIEGHGTSTRVGDVVEVESLTEAFRPFDLPVGGIPLGSVKSNIGHLKGAAGAAGLLKSAFALRDRLLPPSLGCDTPNPKIDFGACPFHVNTELKDWEIDDGDVRRAAVSAFGFGGTNFHMVLEEYRPGKSLPESRASVTVAESPVARQTPVTVKPPLRGALMIGAGSEAELGRRLQQVLETIRVEGAPEPRPPEAGDLTAPHRLIIDYGDADQLIKKATKALTILESGRPEAWRPLRGRGVFYGQGPSTKVAMLFTGQGSQYLNMLREMRDVEPVVADTFDEADAVMTPILGRPLTDYLFIDESDSAAAAAAEAELRQTAITQPAVLTVDIALTRLLGSYGLHPDFVMGHSLGEYGALVAAGAMDFADALTAVSARGQAMMKLAADDNGGMAAVFAPLEDIEKILDTIDGYVVVANINSPSEAVIGGGSEAVAAAVTALNQAGFDAKPLPVSHAFHTAIVAPVSGPLRTVLEGMDLRPPELPIVANVTGEFYPMGPGVEPEMVDILARQLARPVQFVKGLETLYRAGARVFVEVGPKRALQGMVRGVFEKQADVLALSTNHPRLGDLASFNQALCGLWASGQGLSAPAPVVLAPAPAPISQEAAADVSPQRVSSAPAGSGETYLQLGKMFADVLERGMELYSGERTQAPEVPVVITGASLGLPGTERVFDDGNVEKLLSGQQFIKPIPPEIRSAMVDKNITRLVKTEQGGPHFETIDDTAEVIKLAARPGELDLVEEFGYPADRDAALDLVTKLAIGSGLDALRDAGIPLVRSYKTTTKGTQLPDRWQLPRDLRDDTGVIFASAFPGVDFFAGETKRYYHDQSRRRWVEELEDLRDRVSEGGNGKAIEEIDARLAALRAELESDPYTFERRFLFKLLSMGHSQFAELIGARGPNTQINAACASGTQAVGLAEDWIRAGRCRRVVVISADAVTSDEVLEWIGAGFLASGAAATDEHVEDAAIPFDRRRHGMIIGMGAAAMVVESRGSAQERGLQPICEVLSTVTANSAFHGTRLDIEHISQMMEGLIEKAEAKWGLDRKAIAPETVFISHETYTPARGGSAQAEIFALRRVFGDAADSIVIANTKGYTGHPMAVAMEDVLAVKSLETGLVPPVANIKEIDPELGDLNLSRGGIYPVRYALRLGAGFGSQISMSLLRLEPSVQGRRPSLAELGFAFRIADPDRWQDWLNRVSGYPAADLEVSRRTLRVRDEGAPAAAPIVQEPVSQPTAAEDLKRPVSVPAVPEPVVAPIVPDPVSIPTETVSPADPVAIRVLALVAELTGYPEDMLDPDLDMEADLGIDTVKQAEMFAAIRGEWDIPRDDNLQLRDFPTLADAIRFVYERRSDLEQPTAPRPLDGPAPMASASTEVEEPISPPAEPQVAAPSPAASDDPVSSRILELVAELTGYPEDMLDLDLDMEADLGIDTVKQAEMFAAIRSEWEIPRDDNLQLRDFPTLADAIRFVYERRPDLAQPTAADEMERPDTVPAEPSPDASDDPVTGRILELVAELTGYPEDMLDLDLDMEADLGIDTVKQAEMFAAIRGEWDIPRDENLQLREFPTLADAIRFVYERRPDLAQPTAADELERPDTVPAEPSADASDDPVAGRILELVAELTGYPEDMLDLDLDMEADLGIDTVKQAEMFAAIRGEWDIPRDENLQLRDFPTLADAIRFVYERRPDLQEATAREDPDRPVEVAAAPESTSAPAEPEGGVQVPRRVPTAVMRPPLTMCKSTSVGTLDGRRVVVMPDEGGVGMALARKLNGLGAEVLLVEGVPDDDRLRQLLDSWQAEGGVDGVYWLPALDPVDPIAQLSGPEWTQAINQRVKLMHTAMQALFETYGEAGKFLVSATRMGGRHGYDSQGALEPLGGGVSGFTKTFKRERPGATVKVVDFEANAGASRAAEALIDETLKDPGVVEVGYAGEDRWTVGLVEKPVATEGTEVDLGEDPVVVVTGAAGSIVSAIVSDLAQRWPGHFYLLDLTPEPAADDPDLALFRSDRDALKRTLFDRLKEQGEKATPAAVEKLLAGFERSQAAMSALDAVAEAGGEGNYRSVDLLDQEAVSRVIEEIAAKHGRIDLLIHAAGIEISHMLPNKTRQEFDLIFDVKARGWYHLMKAAGDIPIGSTVVFTSIAGRFGNAGQTDYSSANDLLCKLTSNLRTTRPQTRGIAIDWTAWADIGMATRGSIPKMMEQAGIDMVPPEIGIPIVAREVSSGLGEEIVVAGALGGLLEEYDKTGGLITAALEQNLSGPMATRVIGFGLYEGLTVEADLDPTAQPFLFDHQIDGTAVLPGVMGIEAFCEVAQAALPDWSVVGVEDVEFLAPFKFYRDEPRTVRIEAVFRGEENQTWADCRLIGRRNLLGGERQEETLHFTGSVRLARGPREEKQWPDPPQPADTVLGSDLIYSVYFHGPAYQVVEGAWRSGDQLVARMPEKLPVHHIPRQQQTIAGPRLVELCFQAAGLLDLGESDRVGLPNRLATLSLYQPVGELAGIRVVVEKQDDGSHRATVIDDAGRVLLEVEGYSTIDLPLNIDPESLSNLQELVGGDETKSED